MSQEVMKERKENTGIIQEKVIQQKLYEKYIAPTKRKRQNYIGIEIEMPILNMNREAVDFEIIHQLTAQFMEHFHFQVIGRDEDGNVYSLADESTGDIYSYDCSYNNLELSMGREQNLYEIQKRFLTYYRFIQETLKVHNYTLSGLGVNPYRIYNRNVPIPNGRYRMLFHHLHSYKNYDLPMYFHHYPAYGTFCSASQVQLDVEYDELLETINTFSKLEPVKALLFSNSVLLDEQEDLICCRDMFWENSTHGINPHNIGMFESELGSIEELQAYIESTSMYCVERGEKYINFSPIPVLDYFKQESVTGEYYENGSYKTIEVRPEMEDLKYLRTFKFEDLTFRGTIEFRSVCCQPIKDCMTVAAFHVGLKDKLHDLTKLLNEDRVLYHRGYTAGELRNICNHRRLPSFLDADEVYQFVEQVLDLAKEGLLSRGYGEEDLLCPLYERAEKRMNPSKYLLQQKERGIPIEQVIREFSVIE